MSDAEENNTPPKIHPDLDALGDNDVDDDDDLTPEVSHFASAIDKQDLALETIEAQEDDSREYSGIGRGDTASETDTEDTKIKLYDEISREAEVSGVASTISLEDRARLSEIYVTPGLTILPDVYEVEADCLYAWLAEPLETEDARVADTVRVFEDQADRSLLEDKLDELIQVLGQSPRPSGKVSAVVFVATDADFLFRDIKGQVEKLRDMNVSVVLLLDKLPRGLAATEISLWQPNFIDFALFRFLSKVSPGFAPEGPEEFEQLRSSNEAVWDQAMGVAKQRRGLKFLLWQLANPAISEDEVEPSKLLEETLYGYIEEVPEVDQVTNVLDEAFPTDGDSKGKLDLAALKKIDTPNEPFATALFMMWASLATVDKFTTHAGWFRGSLTFMLGLMAGENHDKVLAIEADKSLKKKERKKKIKKVSTVAEESLAYIGKIIDALPFHKSAGRHGGSSIGFKTASAEAALNAFFGQHGPGASYANKQSERFLKDQITLFHDNNLIRKIAQHLLMLKNRQMGGIFDGGIRILLSEELVSYLHVSDVITGDPRDGMFHNNRGAQCIAEFLIYWYKFERSVLQSDDTDELDKHFQKLTTSVMREILLKGRKHSVQPAANSAFRRAFLTVKNQGLELLDVSAVLNVVTNDGNLDLRNMMLNEIAKDAENRSNKLLQLKLLDHLAEECAEPLTQEMTFHQWFLVLIAARVAPGFLHRASYPDYLPDQEDFYDLTLARLIEDEAGMEKLVRVLVSDRFRYMLTGLPNLIEKLGKQNRRAQSDPEEVLSLEEHVQLSSAMVEINRVIRSFITAYGVHYEPEHKWNKQDRDRIDHDFNERQQKMQDSLNTHLRSTVVESLVEPPRSVVAEAKHELKTYAYWVLGELYVMLRCSERDTAADRLIAATKDGINKRKAVFTLAKTLELQNEYYLRNIEITLNQLADNPEHRDDIMRQVEFLKKRLGFVRQFKVS